MLCSLTSTLWRRMCVYRDIHYIPVCANVSLPLLLQHRHQLLPPKRKKSQRRSPRRRRSQRRNPQRRKSQRNLLPLVRSTSVLLTKPHEQSLTPHQSNRPHSLSRVPQEERRHRHREWFLGESGILATRIGLTVNSELSKGPGGGSEQRCPVKVVADI